MQNFNYSSQMLATLISQNGVNRIYHELQYKTIPLQKKRRRRWRQVLTPKSQPVKSTYSDMSLVAYSQNGLQKHSSNILELWHVLNFAHIPREGDFYSIVVVSTKRSRTLIDLTRFYMVQFIMFYMALYSEETEYTDQK